MATYPIYQLYIELEDFEPKIWRRFAISSSATLARLAYTIMSMYEIREYYSYQFKIDEAESYKKRHPEYIRRPDRLQELNKKFLKARYGIVNRKNIYMYRGINDEYGELKDATKIELKDVLRYEKDEMDFYYDPEVNWKFKIILEKNYRDLTRTGNDYPLVIEGEGYGIIESCTTLNKLAEFRENSKNRHWRAKSNYQFYSTYDSKKNSFNFDKFDVDDVNMRIKAMQLFIKRRYEEQKLRRSNKVMKFMKRKYRVRRKKEKESIDKNKK